MQIKTHAHNIHATKTHKQAQAQHMHKQVQKHIIIFMLDEELLKWADLINKTINITLHK